MSAPVLINPKVSADRDRFNQVIEKLRVRLRKGDTDVERVFWTMSRGPRFAGVSFAAQLVTGEKRPWVVGNDVPLVLVASSLD